MILNVWFDEGWKVWEYSLPKNWKDIVTQNGGKDGKPSIHNIMK